MQLNHTFNRNSLLKINALREPMTSFPIRVNTTETIYKSHQYKQDGVFTKSSNATKETDDEDDTPSDQQQGHWVKD